MKKTKSYGELTFIDDFMFCKILTNNNNLCKQLLELILKTKIKKVTISESQKSVNMTYDGKGVRFDVYAEDDQNSIFDIEMQTTLQKDLPKRTRYYQGMIDLNIIQKGEKYGKLRKTFIIFICLDVPFPKNLPVYTFTNICEEDNTIPLGDETTKVIINASGNREGLSKEMVDFLDFLSTGKTNSKLTKEIQAAVDKAIENKEWEVDYMTMQMKIAEEREEAKIEERIEVLKELNYPNEQIVKMLCQKFDLTEEEAQKKLHEYEEN